MSQDWDTVNPATLADDAPVTQGLLRTLRDNADYSRHWVSTITIREVYDNHVGWNPGYDGSDPAWQSVGMFSLFIPRMDAPTAGATLTVEGLVSVVFVTVGADSVSFRLRDTASGTLSGTTSLSGSGTLAFGEVDLSPDTPGGGTHVFYIEAQNSQPDTGQAKSSIYAIADAEPWRIEF